MEEQNRKYLIERAKRRFQRELPKQMLELLYPNPPEGFVSAYDSILMEEEGEVLTSAAIIRDRGFDSIDDQIDALDVDHQKPSAEADARTKRLTDLGYVMSGSRRKKLDSSDKDTASNRKRRKFLESCRQTKARNELDFID